MALENDGGGEGGGGASAADLFGGAAGADAGANGGGSGDGAGAAAVDGAGSGDSSGAGDPDWYERLSAETGEGEAASNRDWVKAKGFKDLDGVTRALRSAEKAIHDKGGVKVPGEGATAEERKIFHKAIGVPDDVKGYALDPVKDAEGNDVPLHTALLDRLAGKALDAGVPAAAYKALVGDFVKAQMEDIALQDTAQQTEAAAKLKEWGGEANAKTVAVNKALEALGLNRSEVLAVRSSLGAARAMDVFAKLGEGLAEDLMVNGSGSQKFGMSAASAHEEIGKMKGDPAIVARIQVPGTPERARYERLQNVVGQEADRKAAAGQ